MYGLATQLWVEENKGDGAFHPGVFAVPRAVVQAMGCDGTPIAVCMPGPLRLSEVYCETRD